MDDKFARRFLEDNFLNKLSNTQDRVSLLEKLYATFDGNDLVSSLTLPEIQITTAIELTANRMHVISGSTDFTPTLPTASGKAGNIIGVRFTNTGITTIDGYSVETIDGVATRNYYQGQSAFWLCDGVGWYTINQVVAPRNSYIGAFGLIHSKAQSYLFNANQAQGYYSYQTSPANADYFTGQLFLNKGTYTLSMLGATLASCGKLDWTLNGVSQTTGQDWYTAGTVYGAIKTFALTVPFSGYHVLRATVNGKNGSSSNYYYAITQIDVYPTAY